MNVLRSLVFYVVFYTASILFSVASILCLPLRGSRYRKVANAWSAFHRWCVGHILGITVITQGKRAEGPVLYAIKHESFFEAIDLATALGEPVVFAKEELFKIPAWGKALREYGGIPVARGDGAKALRFMLSEAKRFSSSGRPLIIFPEGTRVPHGTRPPLRAGFAALYKLLRLPVVPVAIDSGPLYHRNWKRRGTITIRFGDPIPAGLPREEIEMRVHAAINELNSGAPTGGVPDAVADAGDQLPS
ncbi:MAG: 1-acyl-sn-glycerol-3-phosphate acyltransferase [Proteobacteria bacterium]|nr:MAG: 1-acyl-sn-glycerol-3-phosphate acyltransferase [Pseudomonadota bacterium]